MKLFKLNKIQATKEQGLAAIFVTLIMMIVLSIFVLGFVAITKKESSAAFERQESTQAFYAAESGVNDAISAINTGFLTTFKPLGKQQCATYPTGSPYFPPNSNILDSARNTSYSCLLINPFTTQLKYSNISTDHSNVVPIQVVDPVTGTVQAPDHVAISWQNQGSANFPYTNYSNCGGAKKYNPIAFLEGPQTLWDATNCQAPILRLDIIEADVLTTFNPPANAKPKLDNSIQTFFLQPQGGGPKVKVNYAPPSTSPQVVEIACKAAFANPYYCTANIYGLGSRQYYFRLRSIYTGGDIIISPIPVAGQTDVFANAQATIDSTGQVNSVVRRIQVQFPFDPSSPPPTPDFAIQSTNTICKHFQVDTALPNPQPTFLPPTGIGVDLPDLTTSCFPNNTP
jgi:Tfp pilus assembly protein PilX